MATPRFLGRALGVAQVVTGVVGGTVEVGDEFKGTINAKVFSHSATTTVTTTTAAAFAAAWEALSSSLYPEFAEVNATVVSSTVTLTAATPGKPFTVTLSTTEAGGGAADAQTFVQSTVTASSGPNSWSTAANWDTGAAPTTGDTGNIDNTEIDILYDLSQAGATVLAMHVPMSFTGTIGLPKFNEDGTTYPEYRTEYLTLDCTTWFIGAGQGQGSGRIKINSGTVQTTLNVYNMGSPADNDLEALLWKGTHASNAMTVNGEATVGVAVFGGEVATLSTLTVEGNARVRAGVGVTLGTVVVRGGELVANGAITSLTIYDGEVTMNGVGGLSGLTMFGGLLRYNTTGTLGGAPLVYGNAKIDFSGTPDTKTVTNPIDAYNTDPVFDPDKTVSALVIDYNGVSPIDALGTHVRLTRGTPA